MLLLISDANVIIDLEAGGILEILFQLPYDFAMPDALYEEEIEDGSPYLIDMGLKTLVVAAQYVDYAITLGQEYGEEPGFYDRLALALAKQEACPLLTGDNNLRALAGREGVDIRGTLWVFTELIEFGLLSSEESLASLGLMKARKRRLPWDDAKKHIERASYGSRKRAP